MSKLKTNSIGENMILIRSAWEGYPSFMMIPVSQDCPYAECVWVPASKTLAVLSTITKQSLRLVPKLNENGDIEKTKGKRADGVKDYKEQRQTIDSFNEFYLTDKVDIEQFIKTFAINCDEFNFKEYLDVELKKSEPESDPEKPVKA